MGIRIRAHKIEVDTEKGTYGVDLRYKTKGLTVIRAENSQGKSTILNSIIYALGMDAIVTAKHNSYLPFAVRKEIDTENGILPVLSSRVFVEIENDSGEIRTIVRQIHDENINYFKKITCFDGPILTAEKITSHSKQDFHVRESGSATQKHGFHSWLADFIGIELPEVEKYQGSNTPLYIECLFPLYFIEQKAGWTNIQNTMPNHYGIKNAKTRALEFVLGLDIAKTEKQLREIDSHISQIKQDWANEIESTNKLCQAVGAIAEDIPPTPTNSWPPTPSPIPVIDNGTGEIERLSDYIEKLVHNLDELETQTIPIIKDSINSLEESLRKKENELLKLEATIRLSNSLVEESEENIALMEQRLISIQEDIAQTSDVLILKRVKGNAAEHLSRDVCPTCAQSYDGTLLTQSNGIAMTPEDHLSLQKEQKKTIILMLNNEKRMLEAKSLSLKERRKDASRIRNEIQILREDLVSDGRAPSIEAITKRYSLKSRIGELQSTAKEFRLLMARFGDLATLYNKRLADKKKIKKGLSEMDSKKLNRFSELVREHLILYGFKSFAPDRLDLSPITYHPEVDGLDWYYDASASDNIRAIWAYTLALMELSQEFSLNHFGFVIYDEPRQHSAKKDSLRSFIEKASKIGEAGKQVIIATSEESVEIEAAHKGSTWKLINYGETEKTLSLLSE